MLPLKQPGARRVDERRVISGIVHMLRNGGRWQYCPACYGSSTTIYNRYHRWSARGIWAGMLAALVEATPGGLHLIDSTTAQAHRSAAGGKGEADVQAIGRSRGGRGTKIHLVVDGAGRVLTFTLVSRPEGRSASRSWPAGQPSAARSVRRRHLLRQQCGASLPARPRCDARHPKQPDPQEHAALRCACL